LHVLGLPLAFILSQDQTLHRKYLRENRSFHYVLALLVLLVRYQYVKERSLFRDGGQPLSAFFIFGSAKVQHSFRFIKKKLKNIFSNFLHFPILTY
ncbi:hypothetical protein, partial [Spirosoma daeguense]